MTSNRTLLAEHRAPGAFEVGGQAGPRSPQIPGLPPTLPGMDAPTVNRPIKIGPLFIGSHASVVAWIRDEVEAIEPHRIVARWLRGWWNRG